MNSLSGKIRKLTTSGNITMVDVDIDQITMTAIVIGQPDQENCLCEGSEIGLLFNESEVSIARTGNSQISMNNQIPCSIGEMEEGAIFTKVKLEFAGQRIFSLITTRASRRLNLRRGETVLALIKTNEVFLKYQ